MEAVLSLKLSLVTGKVRASMTLLSLKNKEVKIPPGVSPIFPLIFMCVCGWVREQK